MVRTSRRSARPLHWEVEPVDPESNGTVEVRQGRKRKGTHPSEAEALRWIKDRWQEGQKVIVIEPDGYRMDVTRRFLATRKTR